MSKRFREVLPIRSTTRDLIIEAACLCDDESKRKAENFLRKHGIIAAGERLYGFIEKIEGRGGGCYRTVGLKITY